MKMWRYIVVLILFLSKNIVFSQAGKVSPKQDDAPANSFEGRNRSMVIDAKNQIELDKNTKEVKYKTNYQEQKVSEEKEKKAIDKFKSQSEMSDEEVSGEVLRSSKNIENTYFKYLTSNQNKRDYEALKKAYTVDPSSHEIQFEMAKYYEQSNQKSEKKSMLTTLNNSLSSSLKEYAYNTLESVETNGILVTYGKNDTYPIWVAQELEGKRKDVKVLNYDLLMDDDYRSEKAEEYGLTLSKVYSNNLDILTELATKNTAKSIYFSLTVSHTLLKQLKTNLYPVGLAFKYSKEEMGNIETIKDNWENKFQKTQLKSSIKAGEIIKMEMNYILPLSQLARWYKENEEDTDYEEIKKLCTDIAKRNGKETEVSAIFKNM